MQRLPLRWGVGRGAAPPNPHRGTEHAGQSSAQWQEVEVALVGRHLFSVQ